MTDQQKITEVFSLMTFLQKFIQNNVNQSFNDVTIDLENFIKDYLNVFEKDDEKYTNVNSIKHNYPAVDLINIKKDIAIQVTTNANLIKVRKTIRTFKEHKISYSKLIVIGFIKATKSSTPNVEVFSLDYLMKLAKHAESLQLDAIYQIIKRRIPLNILNPLDDKHCFDIVFDVINRSAVRDLTYCEGSFDRMCLGLFEIKEIITSGKVSNKDIRAKTLSEYTDSNKNKLSQIEFHVSNILQICNTNKNGNNSTILNLSNEEKEKIDQLKEKIMENANELAKSLGINKKIIFNNRY